MEKSRGLIILILLAIVAFVVYIAVDRRPVPAGDESAVSEAQKFAAKFHFSAEVGEVAAGEEVAVDVRIDTNNENVVAASAHVQFDPTLLEPVSIDASGSEFEFDAESIISDGLVIITRGVPTPGVSGRSVFLARVIFTALAAGEATLSFKLDDVKMGPTRIILDDGLGTDILERVNSLSITIR